MSSRIPPSAMTKKTMRAREESPVFNTHVEALIGRMTSSGSVPDFDDVAKVIEVMPLFPFATLPVGMGHLVHYGHSCMAAAMWSVCPQVYRFDADFAEELARQGLPDEIPVNLLAELPCPIVYIEASFDLPPIGDDARETPASRMLGFAAWVSENPDGKSSSVTILPVEHDWADSPSPFFEHSLGIPLSARSFDEICKSEGVCDIDTGFSSFEDLCAGTDRAHMRETLEKAYAVIVNTLLYILADNADVEVVHAPSRNSRRGSPAKRRGKGTETVSEVGARIGARIREARRLRNSGAASAATGRTVRPHMRRGHYTHYWVGKRWPGHPGDRRIVHYIEPVFVNGMTTDADEVVHLQ